MRAGSLGSFYNLVFAVTLFGLVTLAPTYALAQANLQPVFESELGDIVNLSWSPDGQSVIFQQLSLVTGVTGDETNTQSWVQYNVTAGKLIYSRQWPLQPALTQSQQQSFELAVGPNGIASYAYASPNNRYIVYGAKAPLDWSSRGYTWAGSLPVGIADLQTGEHIITDISIATFTDLNNAFSVKWSKDSRVFTLKTVTNFAAQRVYYVTGFTTSLSKFVAKEINVSNVTDISADGSKILSIAHGQVLYLDALNTSQSQILSDSNVLGAAFSPKDSSQVFVISQDRAVKRDLTAQNTTTLNANVDSVLKSIKNADLALISPTANTALIFSMDRDRGKSAVYIVSIGTP